MHNIKKFRWQNLWRIMQIWYKWKSSYLIFYFLCKSLRDFCLNYFQSDCACMILMGISMCAMHNTFLIDKVYFTTVVEMYKWNVELYICLITVFIHASVYPRINERVILIHFYEKSTYFSLDEKFFNILRNGSQP